MKTGIQFFDAHEPKTGDLWVVTSGPGAGKSTVLRNIAVGLADNLDEGRITYWDLEQTHQTWRQRIEDMGCNVPAALVYRNDSAYQDGYVEGRFIPVLNTGAPPGTSAVVIDHFNLFTEDVPEGLKTLKVWLVRTGRFGMVSVVLPRDVRRTFEVEGHVDPGSLPEEILDTADAVFVCSKTAQKAIEAGDADTLRVMNAKTSTGLRDVRSIYRSFIWSSRTGRLG